MELLAISERERRLIGHDLHDSLCQHLTATALAGQVLGEKLAASALPEATDASRVVELVEEGITLARNLARGLSPLQLETDGLAVAMESLAETATDQFKVDCQFTCDDESLPENIVAATHLYRIAQEAISNAVRHGKAKRITVAIEARDKELTLRIEDDGVGVPESLPRHKGMGLRIMAHRAAILGGTFSVGRRPSGGTMVKCVFNSSQPLLVPSTPKPSE
jgi:signal transduction histidine kinase